MGSEMCIRDRGKRDFFPNADTVAYFDPQSQTIHLNQVSKAAYAEALLKQNASALRPMLGTMMHEATHWADLVGTLWGRKYLRCLYECFRLLPRTGTPGSEIEFYRFIDLHDQERRMMHSRYFRTVHPNPAPHDHRTTWGLMFSVGQEFDQSGHPNESRHIVFAKFLDRSTSPQIARQPIVAGALLEINAMWSEMRTNFEIISALPKDERAMEGAMHSRHLLGCMYDPNLTLYTAPAHLLAFYAKVSDVSLAYHLSSEIAHIVLNLGPRHFEPLMPPELMSPWKGSFAGFKASHDCGFAFKVIASVGDQWQDGMDRMVWLNDALRRAGLPPAREILDEAASEMESYTPPAPDDPVNAAEAYLLDIGRDILRSRSNGDTALTPQRIASEGLPVVPMFDTNGDLISIGKAFDTFKFSPEEVHALSANLATWRRNFMGACR